MQKNQFTVTAEELEGQRIGQQVKDQPSLQTFPWHPKLHTPSASEQLPQMEENSSGNKVNRSPP